ncbi:hypothetical protein niasHT_015659 [Heterodera trifolii]|uniref:Uncharacterized protein n=1 Tax=Heterodera trifolii TaxID=157864 RepID=A0ABD2L4G2_9BILA
MGLICLSVIENVDSVRMRRYVRLACHNECAKECARHPGFESQCWPHCTQYCLDYAAKNGMCSGKEC